MKIDIPKRNGAIIREVTSPIANQQAPRDPQERGRIGNRYISEKREPASEYRKSDAGILRRSAGKWGRGIKEDVKAVGRLKFCSGFEFPDF